MKFPIKFNCGECDKEHEANFLASFVLDDQGNWYFDLGPKKGYVIVGDEEEREILDDLVFMRTQAVCSKHDKDIQLNSDGQRVFKEKVDA